MKLLPSLNKTQWLLGASSCFVIILIILFAFVIPLKTSNTYEGLTSGYAICNLEGKFRDPGPAAEDAELKTKYHILLGERSRYTAATKFASDNSSDCSNVQSEYYLYL